VSAGAVLAELWAGGRLLVELPRALRRPFTLPDAERILQHRLKTRETGFLALARRAVYGVPGSPYRALLAAAGCEYGDLERLVHQEGLEGALLRLCRAGVYLAVDEFKGRRPVVRGSLRIAAGPARLRNPLARPHVQVKTSGSRGAGAPIPIDLEFVRDHAVNTHLTLATHGGGGWRHAHWGIPGGAAMVNLIEFALGGRPATRWFSQLDPAAPDLPPRYRWSARALRWGGWPAGTRFPRPEHVPLDDARPIARWMADTLRAGAVPHLWTYASSAVRVCQAAADAGLDLRGAHVHRGRRADHRRAARGGPPGRRPGVAPVREHGDRHHRLRVSPAGRPGRHAPPARPPGRDPARARRGARARSGDPAVHVAPRHGSVDPPERVPRRPCHHDRSGVRLPNGSGRLAHAPPHRPER
jgi:hypothetical protein